MRKLLPFLFLLFSYLPIYSFSPGDVYIYDQQWYVNRGGNTDVTVGGGIKIVLWIVKVIDCDTILISLSEDFTPFDAFSITAEAIRKDNEFVFKFTDGWGNLVDGKLKFNENETELSMECIEFSFLGKQHARLYGGPFVLIKLTTNQRRGRVLNEEISFWRCILVYNIKLSFSPWQQAGRMEDCGSIFKWIIFLCR
jgi:hypothetical protein